MPHPTIKGNWYKLAQKKPPGKPGGASCKK